VSFGEELLAIRGVMWFFFLYFLCFRIRIDASENKMFFQF
jgi:hypothetical protein